MKGKEIARGKSTISSWDDLLQQVDLYFHALVQSHLSTKLADYLQLPVDHIAIKAGDGIEYQQWLALFLPSSLNVAYLDLDNRSIAVLFLQHAIPCGLFGTASYLEIMEPKPEKIGQFVGGLDHVQFQVPSLDKARSKMQELKTSFKEAENRYHRTLAFTLNEDGQEVKFTDRPVEEYAGF